MKQTTLKTKEKIGRGDIKTDFQEVGRGEWTGKIWLRVGTSDGYFKCGNAHSDSIK